MGLENQLPRSSPQAQGIPSASIQAFIDAAEKSGELHSFMLLRHGYVVAEGWWSPYAADRPHLLNSLSKSFTSTAIGLAVAEGRLSVSDPVLSFFPEYRKSPVSENLAAMQVKHLLTMTTGHAEDTTTFMRNRADGKWIAEFFAQPVTFPPGTHFLYNSGATYMLSAIIQTLTGLRLLDYLQPRLLEPLGIKNASTAMSPEGIHTGGWGMSVKTEDIARLGQFYLQKGLWHGQRLVSEAWIADATSAQVSNVGNPNIDWEQGYGYQFWRCRHAAYRGDGASGQFCIVMPEQDTVVAITAGVKDMQMVLDLVWDYLLPALEPNLPLPVDHEAQETLTRKLASLRLEPPAGPVHSPTAAIVSKQVYAIAPNDMKIETVSFDFSEPAEIRQVMINLPDGTKAVYKDPVWVCNVTIVDLQGEHHFKCGMGRSGWQEGKLDLFDHSPMLAASARWTAEDTLTLTLRFYETASTYTAVCQFTGDRLAIQIDINFSLFPGTYSLLGQVMQPPVT